MDMKILLLFILLGLGLGSPLMDKKKDLFVGKWMEDQSIRQGLKDFLNARGNFISKYIYIRS